MRTEKQMKENSLFFAKAKTYLLYALLLLLCYSLFTVLTAQTITTSSLESMTLLFDAHKYPRQYHKNLWDRFSMCADLYCWTRKYFSPLFPYVFAPKEIMTAGVFHTLGDKLKEYPYGNHSLWKDPIYGVYWVGDYGPFKFRLLNEPTQTLPVQLTTRAYIKGTDNTREISSVFWEASIIDDQFVILPHQVIHSADTPPKIEAYVEGDKVIVKDTYDFGHEWSVVSGTVSLRDLAPGKYELLYVRNENNNRTGWTEELTSSKDVVWYQMFTKQP